MASESGQVNLYVSISADAGDAMLGAFEEQTKLQAQVYRAGSDEMRTRVAEEAEAGAIGADIVETNGVELALLGQRGLFAAHEPPNLDQLIDGVVRPDGRTATRPDIFTIAVNIDAVVQEEMPKTYQDLTDLRWGGRLVMEMDDQVWYKELYEYLVAEEAMTEEEANQLFVDMAKRPAFVSGRSTMRQMLTQVSMTWPCATTATASSRRWLRGPRSPGSRPWSHWSRCPAGSRRSRMRPPRRCGAVLRVLAVRSPGDPAEPGIDPVRTDLQDTGGTDVRLVDVAD